MRLREFFCPFINISVTEVEGTDYLARWTAESVQQTFTIKRITKVTRATNARYVICSVEAIGWKLTIGEIRVDTAKRDPLSLNYNQ